MSKSVEHVSTNQVADISLDLTGLKCPLPVLKARRQAGAMDAGMVLEVKADDPAAPLDFDHFCATTKHRLLATQTRGTVFYILIKIGVS